MDTTSAIERILSLRSLSVWSFDSSGQRQSRCADWPEPSRTWWVRAQEDASALNDVLVLSTRLPTSMRRWCRSVLACAFRLLEVLSSGECSLSAIA
jgi:hypothetical protein